MVRFIDLGIVAQNNQPPNSLEVNTTTFVEELQSKKRLSLDIQSEMKMNSTVNSNNDNDNNYTWTPLQDALLLDAVEKRQYDWNLVSENVFGKSWAQCKARYEKLQHDKRSAYSPSNHSESESILGSCKASSTKSPHKAKYSKNISMLSKVKRSPAAIKVVQKIMQARSGKSPGKINKGISPIRQGGAVPSTLYGSPLKLKLFIKTPPSVEKNQSLEMCSRSQLYTNQSPPKFDWQVKVTNNQRQHSESSPTIATHYPASLSPFLLSNTPTDPTVRKLKRNYESRSSPFLANSRDSPFQAPGLPIPIKPTRRISPKKVSFYIYLCM